MLGQAKPFLSSHQAMPLVSLGIVRHLLIPQAGNYTRCWTPTIPHLHSAIKHQNISKRLQTFASSGSNINSILLLHPHQPGEQQRHFHGILGELTQDTRNLGQATSHGTPTDSRN
jgi:hypothetical protein